MNQYPLYEIDTVSNLKELLNYCAEKHGDKVAFVWESKDKHFSVSFNDFKADVNALAAYFVSLGFVNEKVAILGENSYEWIVAFFAIAISGNVVVPIDKELTECDITLLLTHSDSKALIYSETYKEIVEAVNTNIELESILGLKTDIRRIIDTEKPLNIQETENLKIEDDQLCAIYYTSGTTGKPKGVMLSHKNLASNATNACGNFYSSGNSIMFLPLSHTFSLVACLFGQLYYGNTNVINSDIRNISKDLLEFKPWLLFAVPQFVETMHKKIWESAKARKKEKKLRAAMIISNILCKMGIDRRRILFKDVLVSLGGELEVIICGGAPLDKKLIKELHTFGINILNGYGITECSPIVSVNRNCFNKHGSAGPVIPGCEVKIVDGEIWVRGDNVMLGYYKDPQATQEVLIDGWFKTGDLGYLDEDGFLFVTGRIKNLILLSNSINVSPEELEAYLVKVDGVLEVLVYQENNGITAEIYPDKSINNVETMIRRGVESLNNTLPKHKKIHEIKFRETEFSKTSTRKIKRNCEGCSPNTKV